jgi:hypothetical protein
MSALGQNQTSERFCAMSALPPKADIDGARWNIRYVPKAEVDRSATLFNPNTPQQAASLTRLSRLITICQRAVKAIPLISGTDRAEISGTDRADCDGTRFAGPPFWRMPQPVLRSVAFPSEGPSIRE